MLGLVSVSEPGHGRMKKVVALHVPLWTNSQAKSSKIFLREHRRGRQHNLKHKSSSLAGDASSVPSFPAAFDMKCDRTGRQMPITKKKHLQYVLIDGHSSYRQGLAKMLGLFGELRV